MLNVKIALKLLIFAQNVHQKPGIFIMTVIAFKGIFKKIMKKTVYNVKLNVNNAKTKVTFVQNATDYLEILDKIVNVFKVMKKTLIVKNSKMQVVSKLTVVITNIFTQINVQNVSKLRAMTPAIKHNALLIIFLMIVKCSVLKE